MPEATAVLAARGGTVIATEWRNETRGRRADDWSRANMVRVRHADGTIATYAHLQHFGVAVEEGEFVGAGKILGYSGATDYSSGPHLHFTVTRIEPSAAAPPPVARANAERPLPPPEVLAAGFARLAVFCVLLPIGMVWFCRFSRS